MLIETWGGDDKIDLREVTSSRQFSFVQKWELSSINAVTVNAGDGRDLIYGSEFGDCLKGGRWDNEDVPPEVPSMPPVLGELPPNASDDTIYGGPGGDTLEGKAGDNLLFGEAGDDHILGGGLGVSGISRHDTMFGGTGNDVLEGDLGNDEMHGEQGNDKLEGGNGDDLLFGGVDNDTLSGQDGSDTYMFNGAGGPESTSAGDEINDLDTFNAGADTLNFTQAHGGAITIDLGNFTKQQVNGSLWLTLAGGGGTGLIEKVIGTSGADDIRGDNLSNDLRGSGGHDLIRGGNGLDTLDGGDGNDVLWGEGGADWLIGGGDGDILIGGAGNDTLDGGAGHDIGRGGAGADVFLNTEDADHAADTVKALPIDLLASSDTGVSSTDNITTDRTPTFSVIAVPGTFVRLFRSTTPGAAGSLVASTMFSSRGPQALTDNTQPVGGVYYYSITTADSSTATQSQRSDQLAVTIDAAAPQVTKVEIHGTSTSHAPYSIPAGSGVQLKTVPVGGANKVTVFFTENVVLPTANPLRLTRAGGFGTDYVLGAPVYNSTAFSATWTLGTALPADQVLLTLDDAIIDLSGILLDGEWLNPSSLTQTGTDTFPSGNGSGGGDFVFRFTILPGDADRNNIVDLTDFNIVSSNFGLAGGWAQGDFSGDGVIDLTDFNLLSGNFGVNFVQWPTGAAASAAAASPLPTVKRSARPINVAFRTAAANPPDQGILAPAELRAVDDYHERSRRQPTTLNSDLNDVLEEILPGVRIGT